MIRCKVTSNVDSFLKFVNKMDETISEPIEAAAKSFLIEAFEIVLTNTPADTGQLMSNWHVYKHGGLHGFSAGGISAPHERHDLSGRLATQQTAKASHISVLTAELEALNIRLFDENHHQVTIGLSNATPYASRLDSGGYNPKPPLVNLTAQGYSIQAPSGIVQVSIDAIAGSLNIEDFGQFLDVGGSV